MTALTIFLYRVHGCFLLLLFYHYPDQCWNIPFEAICKVSGFSRDKGQHPCPGEERRRKYRKLPVGPGEPGLSTHLVEVMVINDHSTDLTEERVSQFAQSHPSMNLRLILTGASGSQAFKKLSIRAGADASTGELMITTDADTRLHPGWISSFVDFYERQHPEMIIGPVAFRMNLLFFERLQSMEFSGLMAANSRFVQ